MMVFAICDDDQSYAGKLSNQIKKYFGRTQQIEIRIFGSGRALAKSILIDHEEYDAIFLDVIMPNLNGIKTAAVLRKSDVKQPIIFVSTSPDYSIDGYYVDAVAYVVKTDTRRTIAQALGRFEKLHEQAQQEFLHIRTEKQSIAIPFSEITTIDKYGRKTVINQLKKEPLYTNQSILELAKQISEHSFFTTYSRSNYINTDNIQEYNSKSFSVIMKNASIVYISRSHMKSVLDVFIKRRGGRDCWFFKKQYT
jgi:DNA-binding LytR/AlgR family response regulator